MSTPDLINMHSKEWHSYCAKIGEVAIKVISFDQFTELDVTHTALSRGEVACILLLEYSIYICT